MIKSIAHKITRLVQSVIYLTWVGCAIIGAYHVYNFADDKGAVRWVMNTGAELIALV